MKRIFYFFVLIFTLSSCKKEDNAPATIVGTWVIAERYLIDHRGNKSHDVNEYAFDCEKDNTYHFTATNDFYLREGSNVCSVSEEKTSKYSISNDGSKITFDNWASGTISSLSQTSFNLTQLTAPITGYREVMTVFKRK